MTLPTLHVSFSATQNEAGDAFTYVYELPTHTWTSGPGNEFKGISHFVFRANCPEAIIDGTLTSTGSTVAQWEYITDTWFKIDIGEHGDQGTWTLSFESVYAPINGFINIKSGAGKQGSQLITTWPGMIPGCGQIPEPSTAILALLAGIFALLRRRR